jgi:DNA-directed RNA polymerase specialized sigma54-like protein
MSLKLTTSLSQRLVLTPQLRQRIEMLQMTTLELTDLIQQQLLENPVLEEVPDPGGSSGTRGEGPRSPGQLRMLIRLLKLPLPNLVVRHQMVQASLSRFQRPQV